MHRAKNSIGQIAIIALLMVAIFGVIGTSIVTQVVYEQRRATIEQKTEQAYYAAEAGIEQAIELIRSSQAFPLDSVDINGASVRLEAEEVGGGASFSPETQLNAGEHFFVNLLAYEGDAVNVCWSSSNSPAALQVMYYYTLADGTGARDQYFINPDSENSRFQSLTSGVIRFSTPTSPNPCTGAAGSFYTSEDIVLDNAISGGAKTPNFLLMWVWYGGPIALSFQGDLTLPIQGNTVTATASLSEQGTDVTRRISYYVSERTYPPAWLLMGTVGNSFVFGPGTTWL